MLWSDLERIGRFFDPWREFERLNRNFSRAVYPSTADFPPLNIWMSEEDAIITSEIPGVESGNIDVRVIGKSVTLKIFRELTTPGEGESFHRRERWQGRFSRTLDLPFSIDGDKVQAQCRNGTLSIHLCRAESEKPRKVAVKTE